VSLVVTRWYYKLYILTRDVTAIYSSSPSRNIAKRRKNLSKVQVLGEGELKKDQDVTDTQVYYVPCIMCKRILYRSICV